MSCAGIYEALELRDGGAEYMGKGVLKVSAVRPAHPVLLRHFLALSARRRFGM